MKFITLLTMGLIFLVSCGEDDTQANCEKDITFTSNFDTIESDEFSIISAQITGQCLEVTIGASGCDGESWTVEMYGAEVIVQVFPPTIPLKLALDNRELCEAYIQRTFSFDLSSTKAMYPHFFISIEGLDQALEYTSVDIQNLPGAWNLVNISGGLAGFNQNFEPGKVVWSFRTGTVSITDNSNGDNIGLEAGSYNYNVVRNESAESYELFIGDQNLGHIRNLTNESFSIDQRAVDGFQYVFSR